MEWYNPRFVFEDLSMEVVKEMSNEEVKKRETSFQQMKEQNLLDLQIGISGL